VYILRAVHVLIGLVLGACLLYLYYVLLTGAALTGYVWAAAAALGAEGLVFVAFGRTCPFSLWQQRYGDDRGFFELFLPGRYARAAFPVLAVVSAIALILIGLRAWR